MKLDRNVNRGGRGKYALVNMRKLIPMIDHVEAFPIEVADGNASPVYREVVAAFELLVKTGIITLGTESTGDQFFVMKYRDKFTPAGLKGYADAISDYWPTLPISDERTGLAEYCDQIIEEAAKAEQLATRIPD